MPARRPDSARHRRAPKSTTPYWIAGGAVAAVLLIGLVIIVVVARNRSSGQQVAQAPLTETPAPVLEAKPTLTSPDPTPVVPAPPPPVAAAPAAPATPGPVAVAPKETPAKLGDDEPEEPMPGMPAPKIAAPVVPVDQAKIDQAIERGVQYLRNTSWNHPSFSVGYTALAGLTLLECGARKDDPLVQRAATFVRGSAGSLSHTYQIALSILFLDRLGSPEDDPIIQGLALRLLAGQSSAAGWSYHCPPLQANDLAPLYLYLQSNRAEHLRRIPTSAAEPAAASGSAKSVDTFRKFAELVRKGTAADGSGKKRGLGSLPASLRSIPVVQLQGKDAAALIPMRDDNSNTQFALLALWVARRHDVPAEQALLFANLRFLSSQMEDGHWTYRPTGPRASAAMTAVGLVGLAVGHGVTADVNPGAARDRPILAQPAVEKGLQFLGGQIDAASTGSRLPALYFMWSVERVGVLYDLKTIAGKDWYGWGSQLLVANQAPDGSWQNGGYLGSTPHLDTCLALLFLKRSNLVSDLTQNLKRSVRSPSYRYP